MWTWDTGTGEGKGRIASITHPEGYSETYTYDTAGRPSLFRTVADGTTYDLNYSYDAWGRLYKLQYPVSTSGFRFAARYVYDGSSGLPTQVVDDAAPTTVFWQLNATNERGLPIDETLGNGLQTTRTFDRVTGWAESVMTGGGTIQDLGYQWDKLGNLTERSDLRQSKTETFTYDTAGLGNIKTKTGAGTYTYSTTHPHQVVSTTTGLAFAYDANGNMTTRNGSTIDWTTYNLPKKTREGSDSSEFRYGPSRARYKQVNVEGSATETTYYIGGVFERVSRAGGTTEHRHSVVANGEPIAIHTRRSTGVHDTVYLHRDHLGSVDTITDGAGSPIVRLSYDAFGKRRGEAWSGTPTSADMTDIGNTTRRGFTFHEHLDNIGIVHMNGRAYDPTIGRFLSADPFVTQPFDSQGFNRYSYVNNNPLSLVDPSGFTAEDIEEEYIKPRDGKPQVSGAVEEMVIRAQRPRGGDLPHISNYLDLFGGPGSGSRGGGEAGGGSGGGSSDGVDEVATPLLTERQKCMEDPNCNLKTLGPGISMGNLPVLGSAFEPGGVAMVFQVGRVHDTGPSWANWLS